MSVQLDPQLFADEKYDIFLCTRDLPDRLTAETAAVRQLCAALAGSGYRVFFPSALQGTLTNEERAARIVSALGRTGVMVAAAVGDEGAQDPVAQKLWQTFLDRAASDPSLCFIPCCRDLGEEALAALPLAEEALDMGDLEFLVKLKEKLAAVLPPPPAAEPPAEEPPAEDPPAEAPSAEGSPEEGPVQETAEAEAPAPAEPKKRPGWIRWVILAAAVVVVVLILLLLKKH